MTSLEAADLLQVAKDVLCDMGLGSKAYEADQAQIRLRGRFTAEDAHDYADFILPRGRRGRVVLVLYSPANARATAFIAAVLRSVT